MAFQTGTSTSIENLLQQLSTFLQANGWTEDFANTGDPGTIGFSKNSIFVSFQYTEATDNGAMAIYQATAADQSPTTDPWTASNDSGNGVNSNTTSSFDTERCCNQFAGPHTAYYFFENDSSPAYCHVVVEVDAGRYRHFGFGEIEKIGDWTGGEYCYGTFVDQGASRIDAPRSAFHNYGLDAQGFNQRFGGTMRIDGYPGEPDPATIWANCMGDTAAGNDTAGNARWKAFGGWRGSREFSAWHGHRISLASAYKPLVPCPIELIDETPSPDLIRRVGFQADVRMCNIGNLDPGQIISISGDDWYFFPWVRKQFLQNDTEETWNAGVAYRRENT
jgi:hypothetical protein